MKALNGPHYVSAAQRTVRTSGLFFPGVCIWGFLSAYQRGFVFFALLFLVIGCVISLISRGNRRILLFLVLLLAALSGISGVQQRQTEASMNLEGSHKSGEMILASVPKELPFSRPSTSGDQKTCSAQGKLWTRGNSVQVLYQGPCSEGQKRFDLGDRIGLGKYRLLTEKEAGARHAYRLVTDRAEFKAASVLEGVRTTRLRADEAFERVSSPQNGRLAAAMVYGGSSGREEVDALLKAVSLSHLSAVSGANCAILTSAIVLALRFLRLSRGIQGLAALLALGLFILICGPEASVLRAGMMGSIAAVSLLGGKGRTGLGLLGLAMTFCLILDPWLSQDIGFLLSVSATAGILGWGRKTTEIFSRFLPRAFASSLAILLCASIACQPALSLIQSNVPGMGILVNLLAAPLVPLITVWGFSVLFTAQFSVVVASFLAFIPSRAADLIVVVARWAARLPANQTELPTGMPGVLLWSFICLGITLFLFFAGSIPKTFRWKKSPPWVLGVHWRRAFIALCVLVLIPWALPAPASVVDRWQVAMCDVGQGDAVLVSAGEGEAVLIDAGPKEGNIAQCLQELGVKKLKAVILTHLHEDHIGGLAEALESSPGVPIFYSSLQSEEEARKTFSQLLPQRRRNSGSAEDQVPYSLHRVVRKTQSDSSGSNGLQDVLVQTQTLTIRPVRAPAPRKASLSKRMSNKAAEEDENLASLGLLVTMAHAQGVLTFLITGDAPKEIEPEILRGTQAALAQDVASPSERSLDILKVAHHGSRYSGNKVMKTLNPALALIGVGAANSYGHPHKAIVESLAAQGIHIRRTDKDSTISVREESRGLLIGSR